LSTGTIYSKCAAEPKTKTLFSVELLGLLAKPETQASAPGQNILSGFTASQYHKRAG
jgi:hypothetical protein